MNILVGSIVRLLQSCRFALPLSYASDWSADLKTLVIIGSSVRIDNPRIAWHTSITSVFLARGRGICGGRCTQCILWFPCLNQDENTVFGTNATQAISLCSSGSNSYISACKVIDMHIQLTYAVSRFTVAAISMPGPCSCLVIWKILFQKRRRKSTPRTTSSAREPKTVDTVTTAVVSVPEELPLFLKQNQKQTQKPNARDRSDAYWCSGNFRARSIVMFTLSWHHC